MQCLRVPGGVPLPFRQSPAAVCRSRLAGQRAHLLAIRPRAAPQQEKTLADAEEEGCGNIGDYCSIDAETGKPARRTLGELEQEFLDAMGAWYYEGKPKMSDEEFELLKEELIWAGSKVATLDSDEQKFLEASRAFSSGNPIMSDEEFDALKEQLRTKASIVTAQGPRCSLRTKTMYSDAAVDYVKMTLLNLPATLLVLGLVFSIDDITGFEITSAIELPPPWGIALLWGILLPALYLLATSITNVVLRDAVILRAPCPNCSTENFTYFGDILGVGGNRGTNVVECNSCSADLTFDQAKRQVAVNKTPEEKQKEKAAAAAKKAALAAKKNAAAAAAKKKAAPPTA